MILKSENDELELLIYFLIFFQVKQARLKGSAGRMQSPGRSLSLPGLTDDPFGILDILECQMLCPR